MKFLAHISATRVQHMKATETKIKLN